jgi:hypothetical protein
VSEKRLVEFERLNLLGKAVYSGGLLASVTARAIEDAIDRAADVYVEAERAFREGLGDGIEDARIVGEYTDPPDDQERPE